MSQININVTSEFEKELKELMKARKVPTKSEAIRIAVRETLHRSSRKSSQPTSFEQWLGLGLAVPENQNRKFHSDDDLWR